jgi:SAM-dependent methyltransferase
MGTLFNKALRNARFLSFSNVRFGILRMSVRGVVEPFRAFNRVNDVKDENKTIRDFGRQWSIFRDNEGFYGSMELFSDILHPFLNAEEIRDCRVAEIGSGTGRIVNMVVEAGAKYVVALEPSDAFEVLCRNIKQPEKVTCLKMTGDQLPADGNLDYIFSVGVLHHIPDPKPVIEAAFRALRPGGRFLVWLYGKEGNAFYLTMVILFRVLTKRLPHFALSALVRMAYWPLLLYMKLCHRLSLPLQEYMVAVFEKMSPEKRRLIIYDQLNPSYSKYYTKREAEKLLIDGKFENVRIHHRHGYSWTVIGTKP